jgi:hypothetical protein
MNLFQWVTISFLAALLLWEVLGIWRGIGSRAFWLFRCLVWITAGVAIAHPELVQDVAETIGIGRGADVLLYLFVLAFLVTSFAFYANQVRLQRQLTEVVRFLAIQQARQGGGATEPPPPPAAPAAAP